MDITQIIRIQALWRGYVTRASNHICLCACGKLVLNDIECADCSMFYGKDHGQDQDDDDAISIQLELANLLAEIAIYEQKHKRCHGCNKKGMRYRNTCDCYQKTKCSWCNNSIDKCESWIYCDEPPLY